MAMNIELLHKVSSLLKEKGLTVATAESCTGGLIANMLTNVSGSSLYFDRGVVSYSNRAKMELLGVPSQVLEKHGAVSEETAKAMAEGVKLRSGVDVGVSTTGIAGPTGGTKDKPVGLVYIGVSTRDETVVKKFLFKGDRLSNKESACEAALKMLFELLK
ncbi:MAG: competence protein ComA [Thermoplasmata archaeon]|nr:MAG: competence protein ComA [Thermoplasmata archaeon]